jgi:hypothetical protein
MVLTGMLVGNAHPTLYQEFRRAKNEHFSVPLELNSTARNYLDINSPNS